MIPARSDVVRPPLRPGIFIPRLSSYLDGFFMLKRPVAVFVIACTFLRLASVSMLESFYPVLLQSVGFSAGAIGLLFAIGNFASSPSSLVACWWSRLSGSPRRELTTSVGPSIAATTVVPAFGRFWLFACAIAVFGFGTGISLPLIFTLLSTGIEPDQQGVAAGLRDGEPPVGLRAARSDGDCGANGGRRRRVLDRRVGAACVPYRHRPRLPATNLNGYGVASCSGKVR